MSLIWPTAASACFCGIVLGRSFTPSLVIPAATAPELTTTISFLRSCSAARSCTKPLNRDSSIPSLDERIWLPIFTTTRRARRRIGFLYSSCVTSSLILPLDFFQLHPDVLHQRTHPFRGCRGNEFERPIAFG